MKSETIVKMFELAKEKQKDMNTEIIASTRMLLLTTMCWSSRCSVRAQWGSAIEYFKCVLVRSIGPIDLLHLMVFVDLEGLMGSR